MASMGDLFKAAIAYVDERSIGPPLDRDLRITLNFHPDRLLNGRAILEAMHHDGLYRSQFETGTSNGGLTAHPGGDRWQWEHRMFGGVYDEAPAAERPKYGALNPCQRPLGGAPRFGSAYLILREHALDRATFCFPDSVTSPTDFGTARHFNLFNVMSIAHGAKPWPGGPDPLDGYVEAHIHGALSLQDDAEQLVIDPCFQGTPVQEQAEQLGVTIHWHEGREISTERLRQLTEYRGPEPVRVGCEIAQAGMIDARIIGEAVHAGEHEPQTLKQLWHLAAQWGSPRGVASN